MCIRDRRTLCTTPLQPTPAPAPALVPAPDLLRRPRAPLPHPAGRPARPMFAVTCHREYNEKQCRPAVLLSCQNRQTTKPPAMTRCRHCLLYTSDAADDLTRVDLGGSRIIKTK